ncbi:MAG: hypothetical protein KGK07_15170 [Chloroflexota bacterium]|nr:hypothetical protein [Chloroflexota bacterium]
MRPIAEKMTVYRVKTNAGTFNVPADALSGDDFDARGRVRRDKIVKYTEGSEVYSVRNAGAGDAAKYRREYKG